MQPTNLNIKLDANSTVEVSLHEIESVSNKKFVVIGGHNYYLKAQGSSPSLALFHAKLERLFHREFTSLEEFKHHFQLDTNNLSGTIEIKEIKKIITVDRSRRGFTSWPLYREVYFEVKDLLEMLLKQGRYDLCSRYAVIGTNSRKEWYVVEFTFAPIEKVCSCEKMFDYNRYQDPIVVWKYFEIAHLFWNIKDEDIERELSSLYKTNPLHAMGTRGTWEEIANVKKQDENCEEPLIFKVDFFKKGLRTLINEIITFSLTRV